MHANPTNVLRASSASPANIAKLPELLSKTIVRRLRCQRRDHRLSDTRYRSHFDGGNRRRLRHRRVRRSRHTPDYSFAADAPDFKTTLQKEFFSQAEPVARGLGCAVGHDASVCTAVSGAFALHWRTGYRAIRAEHAAIAALRPQLGAAAGAHVEELASVGWH